jgi:hypothetical protein
MSCAPATNTSIRRQSRADQTGMACRRWRESRLETARACASKPGQRRIPPGVSPWPVEEGMQIHP